MDKVVIQTKRQNTIHDGSHKSARKGIGKM